MKKLYIITLALFLFTITFLGSVTAETFNKTENYTTYIGITNDDDEQELSIPDDFFNTTGLIGYYKLNDDTSDIYLTDESPLNNTGFIKPIISPISFMKGKSGKLNTALFNGINGVAAGAWAVAPHNSAYLLDDFSASVWIKPDTVIPTWGRLLDKNYNTGFIVSANGVGDDINFYVNGGTMNSVATMTPDVWQMITVTRTGTTGKIYINGLIDTTGTVGAGTLTSTDNLGIGINNATKLVGDAFLGIYDEIIITNRTWTPDEVLNLYLRSYSSHFGTNGIKNMSYSVGLGIVADHQVKNISYDSVLVPDYNITLQYEFDENGTLFDCGTSNPCLITNTATPNNITTYFSFSGNGSNTSELYNITIGTEKANAIPKPVFIPSLYVGYNNILRPRVILNESVLTDSTSFWLCTQSDCNASCQVEIKNGLIVRCS